MRFGIRIKIGEFTPGVPSLESAHFKKLLDDGFSFELIPG